jgi:hypothetical protein
MQGISKRLILVVVLFCLGLLVIAEAVAPSIPQRINYQAVLKNKSTGQILPDGNYSVTFRLYTASTGGSALWSETTTVTISNGILNYQLGSAVSLTLAFDQNYYLGIQVSGDSEMSPRERLTSVGYAYRAANANSANNATYATYVGGLELSGLDDRFLNASGGDSWQGFLSGVDTSDYYLLKVQNYGTGGGMLSRANSGNAALSVINDNYGYGIYAQSEGNAVLASNNSDGYSTIYASQAGSWRAITGYNYGLFGGIGVSGDSYSLNGIGVQGLAPGGIGVYGYSTSTAAVYARNAGKGNAIYAESSSSLNTLEVINESGGRGIYGESASYTGIKGVTFGSGASALYGEAYGNYGSGVYGYVTGANAYGVYGYSAAASGYGVYASAPSGTGVYGYSNSTNNAIYGRNLGSGAGVFGYSSTGFGVSGESYNDYGVRAYSRDAYGVYARTDGSSDVALYGYATGGSATGVRGYSLNYYGGTFYGPNRAISASGDVYIGGDLTVSGSKSGFVVDFCKNSGTETLEAGDVVVITGSSAAIIGSIPLMEVAKTNAGYNTAVVGVVNKCLSVTTCTRDMKGLPESEESALPEKEIDVKANSAVVIQPNEYVNVVTLGAFKAIKVDASYGAIQPGDLLVTSANAGYAMKAQPELINGKPFYPSGCIIGKALGTLVSGQGKIPVFVGHQ